MLNDTRSALNDLYTTLNDLYTTLNDLHTAASDHTPALHDTHLGRKEVLSLPNEQQVTLTTFHAATHCITLITLRAYAIRPDTLQCVDRQRVNAGYNGAFPCAW